jgi:hypothetical protein
MLKMHKGFHSPHQMSWDARHRKQGMNTEDFDNWQPWSQGEIYHYKVPKLQLLALHTEGVIHPLVLWGGPV